MVVVHTMVIIKSGQLVVVVHGKGMVNGGGLYTEKSLWSMTFEH